MATEQWKIGDVTIAKVVEGSKWLPIEFLGEQLPSSSREEIEAIDWLQPTYLQDSKVNFSINSYLVQTPTLKLVVDTCVGNGKKRSVEFFNNLDTDFLQRFAEVWGPADVEGVICTHLHGDHIGWNTRLVGGNWVPTFPNAEYYFVKREFDHWKAYAETQGRGGSYSEWAHAMVDGVAAFEDSVRPVVDAGLVTWVESGKQVTPEVSLIPTYGHTPGHVSVLIESQGESAVITGDLMHCACQVARPDWSSSVDSDQDASAETRRAFIDRFADTSTIVLGTHFGTPSGGHIVRNGSSYRLVPVK